MILKVSVMQFVGLFMIDVVFWGATGQAKVLNEALCDSNYRIVALVDRNKDITPPFPGIPVLDGKVGFDSWLAGWDSVENLHAVVAVGGESGCDRLELMGLFTERGLTPLTVIHKSAFVATDAHIGSGTQILANSAVCSHVSLGESVIINTSATVDHDCTIGNGVHVAPCANLAGEVRVNDLAFIGIGATILPRIRIGEGAIVGGGAVVIEDVPAGVTVVGNPARIIL